MPRAFALGPDSLMETAMAYETTKDIFGHAREFHRQASSFFHSILDTADKERVRMLLDYLEGHEKHLEECLAAYEKEASDKVLNALYKYTSKKASLQCFENLEIKPDMSVDDVVGIALKLDNCLLEFYQEMADKSDCPEVKEVFGNLLEMEKKEKRNLVRDANILKDL